MKNSIKFKLIGAMVLLVLLPSVFMGFIAYRSSYKSMRTEYMKLGAGIGHETTHAVNLFLKQYQSGVSLFSRSESVQNFDGSEESVAQLNGIMSDFLVSFNASSILLADMNGNVQYRNSQGQSGSFPASDQDWFKQPMETGDIFLSNLYEHNDGLFVTISAPVTRAGSVNGVAALDIPIETFNEYFLDVNIGDNGYPLLLDRNGVIVGAKDEVDFGREFIGFEPYTNLEDGHLIHFTSFTDGDGVEHEELQDARNLDVADWVMLSIIPTGDIEASINSMMVGLFAVGAFVVVLGGLVALLVSKSITRPISQLVTSVQRMAEGDLSEKIDISSNDEIGLLAKNFNTMTDKLSSLIGNAQSISLEVEHSANNLASTSEETTASSEDIARTVEDIANGASEQAADTERGVSLVNGLSDKLEILKSNSTSALESVEDINNTNLESSKVMSELQVKTNQNNESTNDIEREVVELDSDIGKVGEILSAIDSISEQTNLLALNASIEAARAGDAGKGFAVVAEEIRKLAEQSKSSSDDIKDIILSVQQKSGDTVSAMSLVKNRNLEQNEAVEKVSSSFETISSLIETITEKLQDIDLSIEGMNSDKEDVVAAMENISSVSQETAASSEEVTASVEQQSIASDEVAKAAESLNRLSIKLVEEINQFSI